MLPARSLRTLQLVCVSIAELAACALVAELAYRGHLALRGTPYSGEATRAEIAAREVELDATGPDLGRTPAGEAVAERGAILHPFLGFEPESDSGGVLAWFRAHGEGPERSVLVLGGSLADRLARTHGDRIRARLAGGGLELHVLDGADPGHKAPQPLLRAAFVLSSGFRPAAVVLIDGFDELVLACDNAAAGVHPVYPARDGWQPLALDVGAMEPAELELAIETWDARARARDEIADLAASSWQAGFALLGTHARTRCARIVADFDARSRELARLSAEFEERRARSPEIAGPPFSADDASVIESAAVAWSEASRSLHALCATRSIPFLHVLQPARDAAVRDPDSSVPSGAAALAPEDGLRRAIRAGYPRLRELGVALTAAGVGFHDASLAFGARADDPFEGPWQLDDAAERDLADLIADELAPRTPH